MHEIKIGIDIFMTTIAAMVMSFFAFMNVEIPVFTMWLTFLSMLCSAAWWIHRLWGIWRNRKNDTTTIHQ